MIVSNSGHQMTTTNLTDHSVKRSVRTKVVWAIYLVAVGVASFGWLAFLSYCALALLGY
jgi:hypothetical protein